MEIQKQITHLLVISLIATAALWAVNPAVAQQDQQQSNAPASNQKSKTSPPSGKGSNPQEGQDPHAGHREHQAGQEGERSGHDMRHTGVNERGDKVMGFAHDKTTHHFRLKSDGGAIEVEANDPNDAASRDQIRTHLAHIARKFATGDFTAPMMIHAQNPLGVPTMRRLKAAIKYQFEETARGGRVRVKTGNTEALKAIHDFLRFQISDHQTGDSIEVEKTS